MCQDRRGVCTTSLFPGPLEWARAEAGSGLTTGSEGVGDAPSLPGSLGLDTDLKSDMYDLFFNFWRDQTSRFEMGH